MEPGEFNTRGRVLAIDFGLKRMGLAVSDPLGITAQGLPTLERTQRKEDLRRIRNLTDEFSAECVILGNPLGAGGNQTAMSHHVARFAEDLRQILNCPVELWDERLTSVQASRMLRASGIGLKKRQAAVDRVAAVLLLQSYLDRRACERARIPAVEEGS